MHGSCEIGRRVLRNAHVFTNPPCKSLCGGTGNDGFAPRVASFPAQIFWITNGGRESGCPCSPGTRLFVCDRRDPPLDGGTRGHARLDSGRGERGRVRRAADAKQCGFARDTAVGCARSPRRCVRFRGVCSSNRRQRNVPCVRAYRTGQVQRTCGIASRGRAPSFPASYLPAGDAARASSIPWIAITRRPPPLVFSGLRAPSNATRLTRCGSSSTASPLLRSAWSVSARRTRVPA